MRCDAGCSCGRHDTMSAETKAKVIAANKARLITNTTCSVEGCEKKVCAKGICRAHYSKARRNAIPRGLPFTVYQWEWDDPRIRSIIESQADKSSAFKVNARQCLVSEVSSGDSRAFLNEHHLQGYVNASARYGLYQDDELVALMTFGKPREQKKNDPVEWELIRFCVKKGYLVRGGASRLFKRFVVDHSPGSIVSYSDTAKVTGGMYPILGFSLVNESAPGYVWWDGTTTKRRYECMAYKLKEKHSALPGIESMTEAQIMKGMGYQKVENMGNKVWVWRK